MLFAIVALDKPDSLAVRTTTRPDHVAHLEAHKAHLVEAGPLLDEAGNPCGSALVVELPDRAAAEAFMAADPYSQAGLFESVTVRGYRGVYRAGARLG